jgi:hypothetical protein
VTGVRQRQDQQAQHERRRAVRALLVSPLLHADRDLEAFRLVRRHADWLRQWFAHEAGWTLTVDTTLARLRKVPGTLGDGTRPARARRSDAPFSRRRYVLLCLALATLETSDPQVALGRLADQIVGSVAGDPQLADAGIAFDLDTRDQRRDLVAVVRLLLDLGVLRHVDGADTDYVAGPAMRCTRSTVPPCRPCWRRAARRPASTPTTSRTASPPWSPRWPPTRPMPATGPSVFTSPGACWMIRSCTSMTSTTTSVAYLTGQRSRLVGAIVEATGLEPEVRAEGIAMVDERGDATDVEVPDQGTDGHLTLLVAEELARRLRAAVRQRRPGVRRLQSPMTAARADDRPAVPDRGRHRDRARGVRGAVHRPACGHWRRDVRDPGAEVRLAAEAVLTGLPPSFGRFASFPAIACGAPAADRPLPCRRPSPDELPPPRDAALFEA